MGEDTAKKFQDVGAKIQSVGTKISGVGKKFMPATLAIVGAGAAMVNYASDTEESLNKVDVAFGKSADTVKEFASNSLTTYGIAKGTALDMAALFGDMGTSMGLTTDEAANMSTSLVGLAGDLASFKNIEIEQAQNALKGIFTGETESLKSLGIVMTQTQLDAFALANGFNKTTSEMSQSELVALRYAFVMDATANAQGDFARTSDGTANQMRITKESIKELAANMGTILLPIVAQVLSKVNEWIQRFSQMDDRTKKIILTVAAVVAAAAPLLMVIGTITSGIGSLVTIIPLIISPVGLVVAAIAALVAIGVLLYQNWDTIKAKAVEIWSNITSTVSEKVSALRDGIQEKFNAAKETATSIFEEIKSGITEKIEAAKNKVHEAIETLKGYFDFQWELPKIKLPHFSISGSFSLNPPSVPSFGIEWYKKGGIMNDPTVFGFNPLTGKAMVGGEAGAEAIAPIDTLKQYISEAVASAFAAILSQTSTAKTAQLIEISVPVELDGAVLARKLYKYNLAEAVNHGTALIKT